MADSESTCTSYEDKSDEIVSPTCDALVDGIIGLLKPCLDQLDDRVRATRVSQSALHDQLESISSELTNIQDEVQCPLPLDSYIKKLQDAKRRVVVVNNLLQNTQERLNKLHNQVTKETLKKRSLSESNPAVKENMSIKTPVYDHLSEEDFEHIYPPSEDTFLLIDAIEKDLPFIRQINPSVCLELGVGAGLVVTALGTSLGRSCKYYGTDINPYACDKALKTAQINGVHLETLLGDLICSIPDLLKGTIDILLFNPPYVPTETEEIASGDLELTWAGGKNGREVIDRLLPNVDSILSPKGVFYLLLERQNKPLEVVQIMSNYGFKHELIIERKVRNELLSVFRFSK